MRTLPDPFGIPGPSFMPSLSARTIPKFYPPDFEPAWKYGPKPFRSEAGVLCAPAKWQRTTPRLRESSGVAQPARRKNRFIRPPWRPNTEILPQSAGPDNPESRSGAYRWTRTIAIPSCRRAFFTIEHTESGFAGHRRRLGKDAAPMLQPQPCHRGRAPSRPLASPHVHFSHRSGIGPARDVPAPPSARGVRTRKGRNLLQPTGKRHPYHSPSLRPVNTEPRGDTGTRSFFRVGLRTSQSHFCIREKWPDRAKYLLSWPLLCRPKGFSVYSVVKKVPLPSGLHVGETARKPTSKPLSVPSCLRPLRVNRPEANRTPRAEGSAGTSHAGPDGHTIPTRTCTHACFISAEQSLHTAATYNHAT